MGMIIVTLWDFMVMKLDAVNKALGTMCKAQLNARQAVTVIFIDQ